MINMYDQRTRCIQEGKLSRIFKKEEEEKKSAENQPNNNIIKLDDIVKIFEEEDKQ